MKNNKLLPLFALLFLFGPGLHAQSVEYLDANNIKSGYIPGATLFTSDSGIYNAYEVPIGSGVKSIFASNFWITGLDAGNNLKGAGAQYFNTGFSYGPVADNYDFTYDAAYKKVFKVTQAEISYHIAHHSDAGYVAATDIAQWPGNGNTSNGEAAILAPFVDLNGNGTYEPALGDYPDVCGDQAIFMMMNDARPGVNSCQPMRIELHILASASAASGNNPLNNTTLLSITAFNRSRIDYHGVYFSNFVDNDLGCANNDRVGCDTAGNYFYTYNSAVPGASSDAGSACPTGEIGYGQKKVAQGTVFLNQKMTAFGFFANGSASGMADPNNCVEYRNYQTGHWRDGTPFTYGGVGYMGLVATPFIFPGNPLDTAQWSELNPHQGPSIQAGDRRSVGSVLIDTLAAGQSTKIDIAYLTSFADSTAAALSELTQLRQDVQTLHQLYGQSQTCRYTTTGISALSAGASLAVYPNPAQGLLTIEANSKLSSVSITDLQGRELLRRDLINDNKTVIDMTTVSRGVYLVNAVTVSGSSSTRRIILE